MPEVLVKISFYKLLNTKDENTLEEEKEKILSSLQELGFDALVEEEEDKEEDYLPLEELMDFDGDPKQEDKEEV